MNKTISTNLSDRMNDQNLKTTLNSFGIGTSLTKDADYFISTVASPPKSNRYETLIKVFGIRSGPIFVVVAKNAKDATINHISMARMAISTDRGNWNANLVLEFRPYQLIEMLDSKGSEINSDGLNSPYCQTLLKMSGVNYPPPSSGFMKLIRKMFGG